MKRNSLLWIISILPAVIMLQTLYFKFSASPESVYIFSKLGIEPVGRIGSGIAELISSTLLLIPSKRIFGALIAGGVMAGAILSHLTQLGIEVMGDGGYLFALALFVFFCSGIILVMEKNKIKSLFSSFRRTRN